jgi:hypothetical protein
MGDTIERLTRLSTMVQVMLAIGLLLLASHAALWREVGGKLSGAITAQSAQLVQINGKIDAIARAVVH